MNSDEAAMKQELKTCRKLKSGIGMEENYSFLGLKWLVLMVINYDVSSQILSRFLKPISAILSRIIN